MKSKKNLLSNLACLLLISTFVCVVGVATSGIDNPSSNIKNEDSTIDGNFSVVEHGVKLKKLAAGTTAEGYTTQTFSYSVEPDNATNQNVTAVVSYSDGTSCSSVMSVSVNDTSKIITLTCKGAFNKVINCKVTSSANSSANATLTVNYIKKFIKFNQASDLVVIANSSNTSSFAFNRFVTPVTDTLYTKDKTYTYSWDSSQTYVNGYLTLGSTANNIIANKFPSQLSEIEGKIKTRFLNGGAYLTGDDLMSVSNCTNAWKSIVFDAYNYYSNDYDDEYYIFEGNIETVAVSSSGYRADFDLDFAVIFSFGSDFKTKYSVGVDKLNLGISNIDF